MKRYVYGGAGLMVVLLLAGFVIAGSCTGRKEGDSRESPHLKVLPELVVSENNGMKEGVSGAFGGVLGGRVMVAGGCNFPEQPAADGGEKVYYDGIYVLQESERENAEWVQVGNLPVKIAYGAAVTLPQGVVCIGGRNENTFSGCVWLLQWDEEERNVVVKELADLPVAMDNMTAATDGRKICVVGGNSAGNPANRAFVLNHLDDGQWEALPDFPGCTRLQPVSAVAGGDFYLIGGYQPATEENECCLPLEILCYDSVENRWIECGTAPEVFVGSAAVALNDSVCVIAGGVNAGVFRAALNNPLWQREASLQGDDGRLDSLRNEQEEYMRHAPEWYRFNRRLMAVRLAENSWTCIGEFEELARAGAVLVNDGDRLVAVNGESMPGIRSAGVYGVELGK